MRSPGRTLVFVVDRVVGGVVVLDGDDGTTVERPQGELGARAVEGAVLVVAVAESGELHWVGARRDWAEEERRLMDRRRRLERLQNHDSGGDITL